MTVLVLGRHPRDEARMLQEAERFLCADGENVLSLRFHDVPSTKQPKLTKDANLAGTEILWWPRLCHPKFTDAAHIWKTQELLRHLQTETASISHVVVGDSHQDTTLLAKLVRTAFGADIVLSPEGNAIFRSRYGGYRWRYGGLASSARLSLGEIKKRLGKQSDSSIKDSNARLMGLLWAMRHLLLLLFRKPVSDLSHLSLSRVDLVLSPWPTSVDFSITSDRRVCTYSELGEAAGTKGVRRGVAYFVSQPVRFSHEEWVEVLRPLTRLPINQLVLKTRGDESKSGLEAALKRSLPWAEISVCTAGVAEAQVVSLAPEFVIGVSSTVLFNVAVSGSSARVISLADSAERVANMKSNSARVETRTDHQVRALKEFGSENLLIL